MLDPHQKSNLAIKPATWGFFLSLALTFLVYFLVIEISFPKWPLILMVMGFAVAQSLIQLSTFFNLFTEEKPKWALLMFYLMVIVVVLVLGGSLWIMYNINYNLMP